MPEYANNLVELPHQIFEVNGFEPDESLHGVIPINKEVFKNQKRTKLLTYFKKEDWKSIGKIINVLESEISQAHITSFGFLD